MKYRFHFLILFIIVVIVSCVEEENQQPVIQSTTASPETIKTGETTQLSCVATDPDGDQLIYSWSSSKGTFPNGTTGSSVTWEAPDESGTNTISIIVSDGQNISEGSVNVTIETNPQLSVTPTELDFGSEDNEKTVAIKNTGTGTLNWIISEDLEWLTISAKSGETTTETDNITVTVDRDDLSAGSYTETITISSENGDQNISIKMEVGETSITFGELTDARDGKTYKTVKIGDQWWMAENLNVGTRITDDEVMRDNGIIEKYCYNDDEDNCTEYGGLYDWDEMMNYSSQDASQGICPDGWHIPTNEEWKILEGYVDSYYGVDDPIWDDSGLRGTDVGKRLKSERGWASNGNGINAVGFNLKPAGIRGIFTDNNYKYLGEKSTFETSTIQSSNQVWARIFYFDSDQSRKINPLDTQGCASSVRCIKDK